MNFNDLQSISEAYDQVHQLDELTATGGGVGFELGRGRKAITANVQTDKGSVNTALGTQKVGGQTSASDAVDDALNRLNNPTAAAKPAPQERTVPYGRVNASFTGGSAPKPRSNPNNTAKPQPPTGTKPTPPVNKNVKPIRTDAPKPTAVPNDSGRPIRPTDRVQNPSIEFSRKPEPQKMDMVRKPEPSMGGLQRMDTMSDVDTYNLVLEYLLDEGFASTEQSADKIILNMSESWFEEIMEARRSEKEGKGSPEKRSGEYLIGARGERKRKGDMGGRHFWSGGEGGSRLERGTKKGEEYSQQSRLNPAEKSGKYSKMQDRKRGSEMGSRFD